MHARVCLTKTSNWFIIQVINILRDVTEDASIAADRVSQVFFKQLILKVQFRAEKF